MNIHISGNNVSTGSIFKLVVVGYFLGAGLIFALPMLFVGVGGALAGPEANRWAFWLMIPMTPIVIAMQGVFFGAIVSFGLWLFRRFSSVNVVLQDSSSL